MKKFFKLVAVVIAIAVIICPMMSVVSHASATGGYKIEALDANNLKLTINSTDGFIAYHATVGFNSNSAFQSSYNADNYKNGLKVISYTLKTAEANDHNAPAISANASGNSLTVIVMPSDINNLDKCTEIVIGIRVADGTTASLTKIQAADDGADVTADPTLLTFPAAGSDGVIDSTAQDYIASNATTNAHTHSFSQQSTESAYLRTAATCTADATYYLSCPTCGLASSTEYFTATGTKIAHTPDNTETTLKQAATCTTNALYYQECSVCHTQLDTYWEKPNTALGHNMTHHDSVSSTCLVQGNIEYYSCSTCGKFFADENGETELTAEQTKRALAAHTPATAVKENEVAATCTTAGSYDSVVYCSVCEEEISRETVNVPATGHKPAAAVEENRVEATCGVDGHYDSVVYCSVCHTQISRDTVVIPATGEHTWGEWTTDADGHSRTCSVCNAVDSGAHNGNPCSVCGYEEATGPVESVLDSAISMLTPQIEIAESLNIIFRVAKATTTQNAAYASVKVVVQATKYKNNMSYLADQVYLDLYSLTTKNNAARYFNVATYELDLPIYAYVACYNENGDEIAHSASITANPSDLLKGLYTATPTTAMQEATNRLITDTLNLGAAAQSYFASQVAGDTDLKSATAMNEGWDQTYATAELTDLVNVSNFDWNSESAVTATTNNITVAADISGAPSIRYGIMRATPTGAAPLDYSKLTMEISYNTLYANGGNAGTISDVIEGSEWNAYAVGKNLRYSFTKAAMYDSDKTITAVVTYDGTRVCTATYSLDSFILANASNASNGELCTSLGKFTASARNYFAVKSGKTV